MGKIVFFGECMVELSQQEDGLLKQSFAGDVFNSAVYLARTFTQVDVSLMTAVGSDSYSEKMLQYFADESIGCEFVYSSKTKSAGLYAIKTDDAGERSFTYWRSDSAAREIMSHVAPADVGRLSKQKMFFFSGISLAVIKPSERDKFWHMVETLRQVGVTLVFDPNYRARLWQSEQEAKQQIERALNICQIALPGIDDFSKLYGIESTDDLVEFLTNFDIEEVVIKNGSQNVVSVQRGTIQECAVVPVLNVVDTTSAGDGFNGVYLGARLQGKTCEEAISFASSAAGFVVQRKGAIVEKESYDSFVTNFDLKSASSSIS